MFRPEFISQIDHQTRPLKYLLHYSIQQGSWQGYSILILEHHKTKNLCQIARTNLKKSNQKYNRATGTYEDLSNSNQSGIKAVVPTTTISYIPEALCPHNFSSFLPAILKLNFISYRTYIIKYLKNIASSTVVIR